jgi:hypothetical protein
LDENGEDRVGNVFSQRLIRQQPPRFHRTIIVNEYDRDSGLGEESSVPDDDTSPGTPMTFEGNIPNMPVDEAPDWETMDDTGVTPFDPNILAEESEDGDGDGDDRTSIQAPTHGHFPDDLDEHPSDHTDVLTMDFFDEDEANDAGDADDLAEESL